MPEVRMPRLSDSMEEGTVIAWLKNDGVNVAVGEEIVEIETDKATMVYAAEDAGNLQIIAPAGAIVTVGDSIARIGEPVALTVGAVTASRSATDAHPGRPSGTNGDKASRANGNGARHDARIRASPLARRMATQLGVALETLIGTGPGGRIVKADVQARAANVSIEDPPQSPVSTAALAPASAAAPRPAETPANNPAAVVAGTAGGTIQELTRLQLTIAERMIRSRAEVPDFTVSIDVNAQPLSQLRAELKSAAGKDRPAPSLNDMVVKAAALALRDHPRANASYSENAVIIHDHVNIGFAVAGQGALLVPVVADADVKSLGQISGESRALAERARSGQITAAELDGGTFTISNLGMYGARECIPVINGSQVAILGVGAARTEPVVADGELAVGQRMRLTIVCDHRVLYGADAAELIDAIRSVLEHPLSLAL